QPAAGAAINPTTSKRRIETESDMTVSPSLVSPLNQQAVGRTFLSVRYNKDGQECPSYDVIACSSENQLPLMPSVLVTPGVVGSGRAKFPGNRSAPPPGALIVP